MPAPLLSCRETMEPALRGRSSWLKACWPRMVRGCCRQTDSDWRGPDIGHNINVTWALVPAEKVDTEGFHQLLPPRLLPLAMQSRLRTLSSDGPVLDRGEERLSLPSLGDCRSYYI